MLTLKECRKLIDPKKEKYTDRELILKRDLLAIWVKVIVDELINEKVKRNEKESGIDGSCIE